VLEQLVKRNFFKRNAIGQKWLDVVLVLLLGGIYKLVILVRQCKPLLLKGFKILQSFNIGSDNLAKSGIFKHQFWIERVLVIHLRRCIDLSTVLALVEEDENSVFLSFEV
jgi:hypothetical protein